MKQVFLQRQRSLQRSTSVLMSYLLAIIGYILIIMVPAMETSTFMTLGNSVFMRSIFCIVSETFAIFGQ